MRSFVVGMPPAGNSRKPIFTPKRDKSVRLKKAVKGHWDERGDEYIVVTEGHLPYCESPEQYVCRMETRREILAVLALCTEKQRERFLLHALYDLSYEEVGKICGCSKQAVELSIKAVRKIFLKFFQKHLDD